MKSWWNANGGLVGVGGFVFSIGLALVFQHGLVVHIIAWALLALALLAFFLGLEPIERRIPWKFVSRKEMTDTFWHEVFDAFPFPAFVKAFPNDAHIADNDALKRFQGRKPERRRGKGLKKEPADDDVAGRIEQDHRQGDRVAAREGLSVQVELTDKVSTLEPRSILTLKSCIENENQKYVVGCYVPVILPADLPPGTSFGVAECGGQILFCCPSSVSDGNHLLVTIGKSVQTRRAESKN
jgi:hypothetical protein